MEVEFGGGGEEEEEEEEPTRSQSWDLSSWYESRLCNSSCLFQSFSLSFLKIIVREA